MVVKSESFSSSFIHQPFLRSSWAMAALMASSGSLLRVVKRLGQMTELVGLGVGSCITHFWGNTELVQTKNASELLLRNRLFREHDGGAMRTLLTLWRVEQYELLDLPQFIEQVFHR